MSLFNLLGHILRIGILLVFLVSTFTCKAEPIHRLPDHYIVAFDPYIGAYKPFYTDPGILRKVEKDLKAHGYDPATDYISVISYTLEMGYPDLTRFARPFITKERKNWIWHIGGTESLTSAFSPWPLGQPDLKNGPAASAQILAKSYTVNAVKKTASDSLCPPANHTYLITITDDVSNGGSDDYAKEWRSIASAGPSNLKRFKEIEPQVFEEMRLFNNQFKFISPDKNRETPISPDGGYRMIWHELVPANIPSIHSATNLPSPLPIKRVRGGYKIDLDTKTLNNKYAINKFYILSHKGDTLLSSPSATGNFRIPSNKLSNGDSISINMELGLKDGVYNGILLSPENPRYTEGLRNNQKVKLSEDAKIYGLIPITDAIWWWFPDNAFMAVIVWDIVLTLIIIFLILFFGYKWLKKMATYVPDDKSIKITHL